MADEGRLLHFRVAIDYVSRFTEEMNAAKTRAIYGATVRHFRHQLEISQEVLADKAYLHRTYISDVERGRRNISLINIETIALALKQPIAAFFDGSARLPKTAQRKKS